ncbi:MAG: hypothetical protein HUU07_12830 [Candidatus Brocadia sinica]|nr:hypothetical protein [Candidatus Brocadia sinica]
MFNVMITAVSPDTFQRLPLCHIASVGHGEFLPFVKILNSYRSITITKEIRVLIIIKTKKALMCPSFLLR